MLDAGKEAIAVVLDLVQPFLAFRRRGHRGRELRLEIARHRPLARAGDAARQMHSSGLALCGIPDPVAIVGDHVQRTAGLHAERVVRDDGVAAIRHGLLVALLDQKPVLTPFTGGLATHPHQRPAAVQFLAAQLEFEHALGIGRCRVGILRDPISAVPQQHRAAAILSFGDDPFEPAIVERVVLDLNREPLLARV